MIHSSKKYFFLFLFTLFASFLSASSVTAQTWINQNSYQNPCQGAGSAVGSPGQCQCNSGYSYGQARDGNCTMDGFIVGCWNPTSGTCNTCGAGGTVLLGSMSCFNSGQGNQGGTDPQKVGASCWISVAGTYESNQCIGSGTYSGGYSTN